MKAQEAVEFLRELLSSYSPSGREVPLARYLAEEMAQLGFDVHIDEVGNVIGELQGANCNSQSAIHNSQFVFLGHIDTVPGFIPVRIEGGRLYGRGTVDAKGRLAAFILAAARAVPSLEGMRIVVVRA